MALLSMSIKMPTTRIRKIGPYKRALTVADHEGPVHYDSYPLTVQHDGDFSEIRPFHFVPGIAKQERLKSF
jgi:hypothetical protein